MANKNEFQPDKKKLGIWDRLHLTRKQRKNLLRWVLHSLALLILSLIQDVILCRYEILGATTDLVPCAIILICLLEGLESSCIFALCASCLYFLSGTAHGDPHLFGNSGSLAPAGKAAGGLCKCYALHRSHRSCV